MKRFGNDFSTQLAIAAAATELAGQATALDHELAEDLVRVAFSCLDELAAFHRSVHDVAKPAAPAWFLPGGVA